TSRLRTLKASDLVCAFWIICCRCESASSGSSTTRACSFGWDLFQVSTCFCRFPEVSLPVTKVIGPRPVSCALALCCALPPSSPPLPHAANVASASAATPPRIHPGTVVISLLLSAESRCSWTPTPISWVTRHRPCAAARVARNVTAALTHLQYLAENICK